MLEYDTLNLKSLRYNKELHEDYINLLSQTFQLPKYFDFDIVDVTEEYIARPDLIALKIYGDDSYADIICKINGISNPFELNKGMSLILPKVQYIEEFNVPLSADDIMEDKNESAYIEPKPKQKNQKRKANEAVTGDSRFKINKERGVVIY